MKHSNNDIDIAYHFDSSKNKEFKKEDFVIGDFVIDKELSLKLKNNIILCYICEINEESINIKPFDKNYEKIIINTLFYKDKKIIKLKPE